MTEKSDTGNGSANFSIDEIVAAVVATLHAMELNCPVEHEGTISAASGAIAAAGKKSSPVGDNGKEDLHAADMVKSTANENGASKGFMCSNCKSWNAIQSNDSTTTWYVITKGISVGVFQGWHLVGPLVIGVSGSKFMKCSSERAGRVAFNEASKHGLVEVLV